MTSEQSATSVDIADYVAVLRRRWKLISAIAVGILIAAVLLTVRQPVAYVSRAQIALPDPTTNRDFQADISTEVTFMKSVLVARAAAAKVPGAASENKLRAALSVKAGENEARVISLAFRADSAQTAQIGAQAFADAYIEVKAAQLQAGIDELSDAKNLQIRAVDLQISETEDKLDAIDDADSTEADELRSQISSLQAQQAQYRIQYNDLRTQPVNPGQVINPAILPESAVPSGLARNIVMGLVAGLGMGIAAAFVLDRLDEQVRESADLEQLIGLPTLGSIPVLPEGLRKAPFSLVAIHAPDSPQTDAFRRLRTSVTLATEEADASVIGITSAISGEGKSTVAANLAVTLAQAGRRVLLISADLRQPTIEGLFEIEHTPGLSDVLTGEAQLADAIKLAGALAVLPDGSPHRNPTDLLQSPAMRRLLAEVRAAYDLVIFDTPPVLAVADVLGIGRMLDGVILVVSVTETTEAQVSDAENQLRHAGAEVLGAIINRAAQTTVHYERYRRS